MAQAVAPLAPRSSHQHTQIVSALGPLFVPSRAGDPGYQDLESHGITDYVLERFPPADTLDLFNSSAAAFFNGRAFLDLNETEREAYLQLIVEGARIVDPDARKRLQTFHEGARRRILQVYYGNYPEHRPRRDAQGLPILAPGDTHQITNPNTDRIVTGWDVAGYCPQPSWAEEEQLRAEAKKTLSHWYEHDLVTLSPSRPPAAPATRTGDGHDYYDVIVLGGGGAGCIVAGRLAERGINPKTGDRLRVAMIEGGDDWTIRDPGIRPGYGSPIRRRMMTNIVDGVGPDGEAGPAYHYPDRARGGPVGYNFRIVGGCSLHYGTLWIPAEEDFHFYREASGVDWDLAKFGDAIQEVRDIFHAATPPDTWWTRADRLWADAGRALGFEMRVPDLPFRNSSGIDGGLTRYDTKGTSLPWAYIGLNHGLKVIPNAEVEKILIDRVSGARPVATGAVYKDKAGVLHEVRAARVICACATHWTPLLLYKSGYGPREILGDKLIVENKNVGYNLSGDEDFVSSAYLAEPVAPEGWAGQRHGPDPWAATTPRPWGELTIQIRFQATGRSPDRVATGPFAPARGWEHKEWMRNGHGVRHIMEWRSHLGPLPATWRIVPPRGDVELVHMDVPRVEAKMREASEIVRAWHGKLAVKPVKVDFRDFSRPASGIDPHHAAGTARAGSSPANSVCTSDFDCHDIDHLLLTSAATIPRTFFWSMGPTAVAACYAWRRMVANHFSTGCSTKGFL